MTPKEALSCLSSAQIKRLRKCKVGKTPPLDLLALDDPRLVCGNGSRTTFGDAVLFEANIIGEK